MRKEKRKSRIDYVDAFLATGGIVALGASLTVAWPALQHLGR